MLSVYGKGPERLPISPLTLTCPFCGAKPRKVCETISGGELEIVHVARIKTAAAMDVAAKKASRK